MNTANKSRSMVQRRSRSSLTWIDFLVILAILLTFVATVSTTLGKARASTPSADRPVATEVAEAPVLPVAAAPAGTGDGLIKARFRLVQGAPWN